MEHLYAFPICGIMFLLYFLCGEKTRKVSMWISIALSLVYAWNGFRAHRGIAFAYVVIGILSVLLLLIAAGQFPPKKIPPKNPNVPDSSPSDGLPAFEAVPVVVDALPEEIHSKIKLSGDTALKNIEVRGTASEFQICVKAKGGEEFSFLVKDGVIRSCVTEESNQPVTYEVS